MVAGAACETTPRNLVVLLPEADGSLGEVTVKTARGTTVLNSARAATRLDTETSAPGQIFTMAEDDLDSIFRSAIAAQPAPPKTFTLYFRTGRTQMVAASRAQWPEIVAEIKGRRVPDVSIVGHTDRAGPEAFNEPLSRRRADIIRRNLIKAGIDAAIIEYSWHGENNPVVKTPDGVHERRNRRVEIIVR